MVNMVIAQAICANEENLLVGMFSI